MRVLSVMSFTFGAAPDSRVVDCTDALQDLFVHYHTPLMYLLCFVTSLTKFEVSGHHQGSQQNNSRIHVLYLDSDVRGYLLSSLLQVNCFIH